ncbi:MAG: lysophospholipid acyltransferase family protein, partial [Gammaproteobacteria bacterium]|nr:lysophospholipid acyltransferase family protein [Gammaproteobacteria bacterium]
FARLLWIVGLLPLGWAHALGALLGSLISLRDGRTRRTVQTNLALCFPELGAHERQKLARRTLRETGKAVLELGAIWGWSGPRIRALFEEADGAELLAAATRRGRGVLIAAPHLGCWEMTSHYAQLHGYRLTALYRPPRQRALGPLVRSCRQRFGAVLVPTDAGGIKALLRALQRGECVGILPDQDAGEEGVLAPFFGIPASTMVLYARLAQRSGATLLLAFAERLRGGRFRLHLRPLPDTVRADDPVVAATALNLAIESCVREIPEQYQWTYRRFKTRPPGEPPRYR